MTWNNATIVHKTRGPRHHDAMQRGYRGPVPVDQIVDREPCPFCAVRADVGCKHRRKG